MDDEIESILYMCREVMVYRVPPRTSNAGYRAEQWGDLSQYLWKGRMRIIETKICVIKLEDSTTGDVFAQSPYDISGAAVEPVLDSSRYFVLRVEDAESGKKAYIGIGFAERSDAFDFNVALQDYTKRQKALLNPPEASDQPSPSPHLPPGPKQDFSLKAGETLGSISIPGGSSKRSAKTTTDLLGPTKASGSSSGILPLLPPPPTAPKRR
ncbi:hypothetical protein FRC03_002754 [Tulasnella sp. 419]|nr:hypothetical protein FRC03_002754 [Tulasnella sp. 419]